MTELIKATGETLGCESVTRGQQFPYLYIHTHALSWPDAYAWFTDPAGMIEMRAVETFVFPAETENGTEPMEGTKETVYRGYTELYCIQRDPLDETPGELMIWLKRPEEA